MRFEFVCLLSCHHGTHGALLSTSNSGLKAPLLAPHVRTLPDATNGPKPIDA